jgi:GNAT superfamily N-acetyltransferase
MPLHIRPLEPADRARWEPLWQGYLRFYKAELAPDITETNWQRFMDPSEPMHVWGAFEGETLLGIVQCMVHRTSWSEKFTCYLQDLFTVPEARGKGVGRKLIEQVLLSTANYYFCTCGSKNLCNGIPDSFACACDKGDFSIQ